MTTTSRRWFLRRAGAVTLGFLSLRRFLATPAYAQPGGPDGPLPDPEGLLDLPRGFSYRVLSRTGEVMSDGLHVPGAHDGMAAFPGPEGTTLLVRNHELTVDKAGTGPFGAGNVLLGKIDRAKLYDAGRGEMPGLGGTTTLVYDTRKRELKAHFLSLAGTWRNCAGGPTPWNSWLSCEETVQRAEGPVEKDHGYVFEVPASATPGLADPVPLRAMGRFNHEAVAVDPRTGIVYLTEDRGEGLLYRFIPDHPGRLARGGRLQALALRDRSGADTRNHGPERDIPVGRPMDVEWIDLQGIESPGDDLRYRGSVRGAAVFSRGEGMWHGRDAVYFACTDGGPKRKGQIWRYVPGPDEGKPEEQRRAGRLELFVEPDDAALLENADNLTVAPWGDLLVCEDGPEEERVVGITPEGRFYVLARNALNHSEFAGATFAPDGSTLFVNIQGPGLTLAITGPWPAGK